MSEPIPIRPEAEPAGPVVVVHGGKELPLPTVDDLDWGEVEDLEAAGYDMQKLEESSKVRATVALMWIALRRSDPSVTLEQTRRVKVSQVVQLPAPKAPRAPADRKPRAPRKAAASRRGTRTPPG